jgi:hypothetical protein
MKSKTKRKAIAGLSILALVFGLALAGCPGANDSGNGGSTLNEGGNAVIENEADFGSESAKIQPELVVTDLVTWNVARSTIADGGNNKNYIITVKENVTGIDGASSAVFGSVTGIKVSLRGTGTLSLEGNSTAGALIYTGANQTIILRGPSLKGKAENTKAVVYIQGSDTEFRMETGTISGNTSNDAYAGGVSIMAGKFIMNGGTISGNTNISTVGVVAPGGVYVHSRMHFIMNGGSITSNTGLAGGGVTVNYGHFTMNGGIISNNTGRAGGVWGRDGSFIMTGGSISGNTGRGVEFSSATQFEENLPTIFRKTGGIIYGSNADASLKNTISGGNGNAVYFSYSPTIKYRNTTTDETVNLIFENKQFSGGWEDNTN